MVTAIKWMFLLVIGAISLLNHAVTANGQDGVINEETFYLRQERRTVRSIFKSTRSQCSKETPCDACEGDCNRDSDCNGDLKCFQRNNDDDPHPPDCKELDDSSRSDFCYEPYFERPLPRIEFLGDDFCTFNTCSLCEGGCNNDDQCKGPYKCLLRKPKQSVPGCSGGSNDDSQNGYCYDPEFGKTVDTPPPFNEDMYPELVYKGDEYCDKHLCGVCEGDCNSDDDCQGHLVCYKRGEEKVVPGCRGGESETKGTDYCVVPSRGTGAGVLPSLGNDQAEVYPKLRARGREYCSKGNQCGRCEGDCDTDEDCKGRLVCYVRVANQEVPGCSGGGSNNSTASFCTEKSYNRE